jgi:hypothetical protein
MSASGGPDLITNGLVLCLDAGNPKSYSGSGTVWKSLISKDNAALVSGPTFNSSNKGVIFFDGSNDYATQSTVLTDSYLQGNWTASFWLNFYSINTGTDGFLDRIILQHGTFGTRQGLHFTNRNSRLHFGLYSDDLAGNAILNVNTWYNVVFTLNNTTRLQQIYLNSILDRQRTANGSYIGTTNNVRIAGQIYFGLNFHGLIGSCSFYNRVLTATEMRQNYNALKGRFLLV